jgi:hypothetical protein
MPDSVYPKRPPYFAHRFIRHMARTCVGNVIGTDACWLLTVIAMTEDAKKYSGAVTFYTENLADQCGFSLTSMKRARRRAVEAGWLHYIAGSKGRAARYWVILPASEHAKSDGPTDEDSKTGAVILGQVDPESGRNPTQNPDGIRTESGPESGRNPASFLTSSSSDSKAEDGGDVKSDPTKPETQKPSDPESLAQSANPSHVIFPTSDGDPFDFTEADRRKLAAAYPGVDILAEVRKSLVWIEADGLRERAAMPKFLASWFGLGFEKGTLAKLPQSAPQARPNPLQNWRNVPPAPPMVRIATARQIATGGAK